jgi:hypothetical protein
MEYITGVKSAKQDRPFFAYFATVGRCIERQDISYT